MTRPTIAIRHFANESDRAALMLARLRMALPSSGLELRPCDEPTDWVLIWGPGGPGRAEIIEQQTQAGGHTICLDLAYWQRDHKVRVSIDAPHPQAWVLRRNWSASRLRADGVRVAEGRWSATGPVVVAGLGRKAMIQYGSDRILAWERAMITACRDRWPTRPVIYRRKQVDAIIPDGAQMLTTAAMNPTSTDAIDRALEGVSLVITWHSNVGVDAIRLGIPVICRDGAAAAVCPETFGAEDPIPLAREVRERFLANLAWFQWTAAEAPACWAWLRELIA